MGFEDVKGQDAIVTTLKNQLSNDRVGHAYLFSGTRGTGKTTIAKIFAKSVNCEHPVNGNPCGECAVCKAITSGSSLNVIEIDAASNNGVDNIRQIVDEVTYSPTQGRYKVYIIDEVHMLSTGAFNALLKTLEEPPAYVIFILATTEIHKIPITILSRCQRYDFKRISNETITGRLQEILQKENIEAEEKAVRYVARAADGSMRDGLSLLDQCIAFHLGQKLTYEMVLDVLGAVDTGVFSQLFRGVLDRNVPACMDVIAQIVDQGREPVQFIQDFIWYLRNLLLLQVAEGSEDVLGTSAENQERMKEEATLTDSLTIMRYIRVLSELTNQIRYAARKRVLIEVALIKLCKPEMETDNESVLERIRVLEDKMENGAVTYVAAPGTPTGDTSYLQEPKATLPAALPEDVELARNKWPQIIAQLEQPLPVLLKKARVSIENNQLALVFTDNTDYDFVRQETHITQVKEAIAGIIGKEAEVKVISTTSQRETDHKYPDILQGAINLSGVNVGEIEEDGSEAYEDLPVEESMTRADAAQADIIQTDTTQTEAGRADTTQEDKEHIGEFSAAEIISDDTAEVYNSTSAGGAGETAGTVDTFIPEEEDEDDDEPEEFLDEEDESQ